MGGAAPEDLRGRPHVLVLRLPGGVFAAVVSPELRRPATNVAVLERSHRVWQGVRAVRRRWLLDKPSSKLARRRTRLVLPQSLGMARVQSPRAPLRTAGLLCGP